MSNVKIDFDQLEAFMERLMDGLELDECDCKFSEAEGLFDFQQATQERYRIVGQRQMLAKIHGFVIDQLALELDRLEAEQKSDMNELTKLAASTRKQMEALQ